MSKVSISIPKDWTELNDAQLKSLYHLISELELSTIEDVMVLLFWKWSGLEPVAFKDRETVEVKLGKQRHIFRGADVLNGIQQLSYIKELPNYPVRISELHSHPAYEDTLEDATFETYIACDNLYQGYLVTKDEELLQEMERLLYRCEDEFSEEERVSILYWWSGLKRYLSGKYLNLFSPAPADDRIGKRGNAVEESMNSMIRALTKGDITKEKTVLAQPLHRALTELDAQAREYAELKAKTK